MRSCIEKAIIEAYRADKVLCVDRHGKTFFRDVLYVHGDIMEVPKRKPPCEIYTKDASVPSGSPDIDIETYILREFRTEFMCIKYFEEYC